MHNDKAYTFIRIRKKKSQQKYSFQLLAFRNNLGLNWINS